MDSLEIEGKNYVSAKYAAKEHSYTMDYIGQLIRGGKLVGKKVGRSWYVEEDSLAAYAAAFSKDGSKKMTPAIIGKPIKISSTQVEAPTPIQAPVQPLAIHHTPVERQQESMLASRPEISGRFGNSYPMLTYVQDDKKELLPEIKNDSYVVPLHRKEEPLTSSHTPVEEETRTLQVQERDDSQEEEESYDQTSQPYAAIDTDAQVEAYMGALRPKKHRAVLPLLVGAAVILIIASVVGASSFLIKTINYEGSTASVTTSIDYNNN